MGWQIDVPVSSLEEDLAPSEFETNIEEALRNLVDGDESLITEEMGRAKTFALSLAREMGTPFVTASLSGHAATDEGGSSEGQTNHASVSISISGADEPQAVLPPPAP